MSFVKSKKKLVYLTTTLNKKAYDIYKISVIKVILKFPFYDFNAIFITHKYKYTFYDEV